MLRFNASIRGFYAHHSFSIKSRVFRENVGDGNALYNLEKKDNMHPIYIRWTNSRVAYVVAIHGDLLTQ